MREDWANLIPEGRLFKVGDRVGGFAVTGLLGVGASAEVWCARGEDGRLAAVKALRAGEPGARVRFLREARLLAGLSHPGIVRVFAHGERGATPWFAMEVLEPLPEAAPEPTVRRWALQLCDAAEELHRHGVLHRDIKRSNVMLRGGHAVLVDFGVAKALTAEAADAMGTLPNPTLAGAPAGLGTLGRSAPEQFEGAPLSAAADVYAIAMLVRDLLPDWQAHPLWRRVMARALVADPALRLPTPRTLGAAICRGARRPWLEALGRWLLPWAVVGVALGWEPVCDWARLRGWTFSRTGFYAKEHAAFKAKTVYATVVLTERVTEIALPDNPGGVVWCGSFSFMGEAAGPQRVILYNPSGRHTLAIGNVYVGGERRHEVVLVGDVDYHCTDIHGYVPYPSPTDVHLLGRRFSEEWVDHVRPVSPDAPVRIRRAPTLAAARALEWAP